MAENSLELWYWKIPGRASLPYVLFRATKTPVHFSDKEAEAELYKDAAPFGQLPVLHDRAHGVVLAQSAGISVYAARLTGLDGGQDLQTYAQVLQYIELEAELSSFLSRALYTGELPTSPERVAAWAEAKKKIDVKLDRVVALLGSREWLAAAPSAADFALATSFWLLTQPDLFPELKGQYPPLVAHTERLLTLYPEAAAAYTEMNAWEVYYKR